MEPLTLSTEEVAREIGVEPSTLRRWRAKDIGPPFVRLGSNLNAKVRYSRHALAAWLAAGAPLTTPARPPHSERVEFARPRRADGAFLPGAQRQVEFA